MRSRRRFGFTLIEIMVVVAIIGVLIGILLPVLQHVRRKSNIAKCESNLKQLLTGLKAYQVDYASEGDCFPATLTYLVQGGYLPQPKILVCPFDISGGHAGTRHPNVAYDSNPVTGVAESGCSYFFEFSGKKCAWINFPQTAGFEIGPPDDPLTAENDIMTLAQFDTNGDGVCSWGEAKWVQLKFGDYWLHGADGKALYGDLRGWPPSVFPVIRCFWHQSALEGPKANTEKNVLNQSIESRQFFSGMHWEESVKN